MVLVLQNVTGDKYLIVIKAESIMRACLFLFLFAMNNYAEAQTDTARQNTLDSLLTKPKGLLGQITHNLLTDTTSPDENPQRNDEPFLKYENRIIRNIIIQSLEFGTLTRDTVRRLDKRLARFANNIHYKTRAWAVHNNLFFRENDKVSPYLLGNNERYLRDLPYLREARILVWPVRNTDSVDVIVVTKDVLSLGGKMSLRNSKSAIVEIKEDNFGNDSCIEFFGVVLL